MSHHHVLQDVTWERLQKKAVRLYRRYNSNSAGQGGQDGSGAVFHHHVLQDVTREHLQKKQYGCARIILLIQQGSEDRLTPERCPTTDTPQREMQNIQHAQPKAPTSPISFNSVCNHILKHTASCASVSAVILVSTAAQLLHQRPVTSVPSNSHTFVA